MASAAFATVLASDVARSPSEPAKLKGDQMWDLRLFLLANPMALLTWRQIMFILFEKISSINR